MIYPQNPPISFYRYGQLVYYYKMMFILEMINELNGIDWFIRLVHNMLSKINTPPFGVF